MRNTVKKGEIIGNVSALNGTVIELNCGVCSCHGQHSRIQISRVRSCRVVKLMQMSPLPTGFWPMYGPD